MKFFFDGLSVMTFLKKTKKKYRYKIVLNLTLVDWLNKLKQRENNIEGTRQISLVTSGKGMIFSIKNTRN
jgi:hypothetical protein